MDSEGLFVILTGALLGYGVLALVSAWLDRIGRDK